MFGRNCVVKFPDEKSFEIWFEGIDRAFLGCGFIHPRANVCLFRVCAVPHLYIVPWGSRRPPREKKNGDTIGSLRFFSSGVSSTSEGQNIRVRRGVHTWSHKLSGLFWSSEHLLEQISNELCEVLESRALALTRLLAWDGGSASEESHKYLVCINWWTNEISFFCQLWRKIGPTEESHSPPDWQAVYPVDPLKMASKQTHFHLLHEWHAGPSKHSMWNCAWVVNRQNFPPTGLLKKWTTSNFRGKMFFALFLRGENAVWFLKNHNQRFSWPH